MNMTPKHLIELETLVHIYGLYEVVLGLTLIADAQVHRLTPTDAHDAKTWADSAEVLEQASQKIPV